MSESESIISNKKQKTIHTDIFFLILFFLIALIVRLWGINFGLPYTYHYDESFYVSGALNMGAGVFGKQTAPTGMMNILFAEYASYYLFGKITQLFISLNDFNNLYRSDPSSFFLLGRITSVFFGSLTVLVVYDLGRRLLGKSIGIISAIFLTFSFLHVRDSHFAVPDIAMSFLVIFTVYLTIVAIQSKKVSFLFLSAIIAGLAISFKWTAWPIVFPVAICAAIFRKDGKTPKSLKSTFQLIFFIGIILIASFLINSFQFVFAFREYFNYFLAELTAGKSGGFSIWLVDSLPGWLFYIKTLVYGLGWGIFFLAITGIASWSFKMFKDRKLEGILFISFPLIYYLVMGATRHYFARYALPLIPFLVIFAGYAVEWSLGIVLKRWQKWIPIGTIALTTLVIVQPLISSLRFDYLLTQTDTRTLAKTWIEENLPEGSLIAIDWYVHTPSLSTKEKSVPYSKRTYEVVMPGILGLYEMKPNEYRQQGFDYLISSSFISEIPVVDLEIQKERQDFYVNLDQEFLLMKTFYPTKTGNSPSFIFDEIYGPVISLWQRDHPGPVIKIYSVKPDK